MNALILSPLEEIIDARVLEFYEKRVGILQQLSVDSLLDNTSFAWALHHVFSITELIDILIDQELIPIEEIFLESLLVEVSNYIYKLETDNLALKITETESRYILDYAIYKVDVCGEFFLERAMTENRLFDRFFKQFCDQKTGEIIWLQVANHNYCIPSLVGISS